jgi:hypothetical protein
VSLLDIVLWVVGVAVVLPLAASFLMTWLLGNTDNEGLYDEEDS